MRYFLDTEFIEYPCTIDLISIGIISETGREYYAISTDFNPAKASDWVKKNVIWQLPDRYAFDEREEAKAWKSRDEIRDEVLEFCNAVQYGKPEFWGYYCDYDWVVFCWLFGTMMELPKGFPMYCRDIKQFADDIGNPSLPEQGKGEHNALEDARWNREAWHYLCSVAASMDT